MKCNVPLCTSDSSRQAKSLGITFHSFPKDLNASKAWVEALGTTNWTPKDKSFICSEHFKEEDFYETQDGNRKLYGAALPVKLQNLDAPAALRVCRICLVLDAKMYDINKYNLILEQITGVSMSAGEAASMPQRVCWECASRLTAAASLRAKALLSSKLLCGILKTADSYIKIRDIRSINRRRHRLKSNLLQKVFDSEFFIKIQGTDEPEVDTLKEDNIKAEEIPIIYQHDNIEIEDKTNIFVEIKEQVRTETNDSDEDNMLELMRMETNDSDEENMLEQVGMEAYDSDEENMSEDVSFNLADDSSDSEIEKDLEPRSVRTTSKAELSTDEDSDMELIEIYKHVFRDMNYESEGNNKKVKDGKKVPSKWIRMKKPPESGPKSKPVRRYFERNIDSSRPRYGGLNSIPVDETLFTIKPLTYEEEMQEMQNRQERAAYKNSAYKCTFCYTGFQNKDAYNRHAIKHTEQAGVYECSICKVRCKKNYILRRHMMQHNKEYTCKECDFVTRHKTAAHDHVRYHAGKRFECSKCSSVFEKRSTYLSHLRLNHTSGFVCELCGFAFVSKKGVSAHKNKKHNDFDPTTKLEGPHCDVCDVTFLSEHAHATHLRVSANHLKNEHDPNRIRNEVCNKKPSRKGPSSVTKRETNKPVECEQCGITLLNNYAYSRHFNREHPGMGRTHYPAPRYPAMCEECGKIFQSVNHLECHQWVHSGCKQFHCDQCNKSFTQKGNLIQHMLRHTGDKSANRCPHCDKYFTYHCNLKRHLLLHSGLKPYKCHLCEKCFPTSDHRKSHVDHFHLHKPWPKKIKKNKEFVEN